MAGLRVEDIGLQEKVDASLECLLLGPVFCGMNRLTHVDSS